jgi:hypothetical protein
MNDRFLLARNNGRVCFESDVPMLRGNPYRKGSPSSAAFISGYLNAAALADPEARHLNQYPKGRS